MSILLSLLGLAQNPQIADRRFALAVLDRDQRAIRNQYVAFADRTNS